MLISDLIADLRLDLSDSGASLFEDPTLERCVRKAVFRVGKDLQIDFIIRSNGRIRPTPENAVSELMIILAHIHACQVMRSATANAFSFSSGDKRVDKTGQPGHWAKLEADLMEDYRQRLGELRPETQVSEESYIITPGSLSPVVYEHLYGRGSQEKIIPP